MYISFLQPYSAPQCSHCKRCTSYSISVCLSVRPSVRLSHAGIVSKRRHVARCSLHCHIAKCVYTVNQKKRGSLFLTITLANLNLFFYSFYIILIVKKFYMRLW